jgi:hypothetical protein
VRHGDTVRHHLVCLAVVNVGDARVVVVAHTLLLGATAVVVAWLRGRRRVLASPFPHG